MTRSLLEDFGRKTSRSAGILRAAAEASTKPGGYEDGYNSGWEDALVQVAEEQSRIGDSLAQRLVQIEHTRDDAMAEMLGAVEPLLQDIFDKLLPQAANRGFLIRLMQEVEAHLEETNAQLTLLVAPEEVVALETLLNNRDDLRDMAQVKPEPALALSQAILSWTGGQRRLDLQAVMAAMDAALEEFNHITPNATQTMEADYG